MAHVALPRPDVADDERPAEHATVLFKDIVQGDAAPAGDVDDLAGHLSGRLRRQEVGRDRVVDEAEVPGLLAVAEHGDGLPGEGCVDELRNGGGVRSLGTLAGPANVEITKMHRLDAVERREDGEVPLAGELGHRVR